MNKLKIVAAIATSTAAIGVLIWKRDATKKAVKGILLKRKGK